MVRRQEGTIDEFNRTELMAKQYSKEGRERTMENIRKSAIYKLFFPRSADYEVKVNPFHYYHQG